MLAQNEGVVPKFSTIFAETFGLNKKLLSFAKYVMKDKK